MKINVRMKKCSVVQLLGLLMFTCTVCAQVEKESGQDGLDIPFEVVDQVPVFPGCGTSGTHAEQKKCISTRISDFVNRNFNTSLGKELGLTGVNRIYVKFKISEAGEVVEVESRAPHPALGKEAERVVGSLPKMEPAIHRGEKTAILYALPISLNVPAENIENRQD